MSAAKIQPAEATAYLQIELRRRSSYSASEAREGWDAFEPEAVIDVPADLIQHPIQVEAEDPS